LGGFKYDTTGGAICITMEVVVALWCDGGRSEWNVVNMRCHWWCVCGGLRCAAASPPVLLFSAPPEQPPGLVVQEKQSHIALANKNTPAIN